MAKYDWKQLEKEYILSDYKSVSAFLKNKNINNNGTTRKHTSGWKNKKRQKEDKKATEIIEKVIKKESEKEAQKIVNVKDVANELLNKIVQANNELDRHIAKSKTKTKKVRYNQKTLKPFEETIEEKEEIKDYISIIDKQGLKMLSSALKDLNEILQPKEDNEKLDKVDELLSRIKEEANK